VGLDFSILRRLFRQEAAGATATLGSVRMEEEYQRFRQRDRLAGVGEVKDMITTLLEGKHLWLKGRDCYNALVRTFSSRPKLTSDLS
jgi:hypothetical protein